MAVAPAAADHSAALAAAHGLWGEFAALLRGIDTVIPPALVKQSKASRSIETAMAIRIDPDLL